MFIIIYNLIPRMLIFSPHAIRNVLVSIDNYPLGEAEHVKGSLFTLPWKAKNYNTGFHHIEVSATVSCVTNK